MIVADWIYEVCLRLGMPLRFCNPRRNQVAPKWYLTYDSLRDGTVPSYFFVVWAKHTISTMTRFHHAFFVALPVAITFHFAFVVQLFALGQTNF